MPTSQQYQISKIVNLIVHLNPKSVLDIGAGFGKYGVLCREYLELWDGREDYEKFTRRIDCVEVFEKYLTPIHKYVYDHCYSGDASQVVKTLTHPYELGLFIDVLEHFEREEGEALVRELLEKCESLLISVPKDMGEQGTVFGNAHEAHLAQWNSGDLLKFARGFRIPDPMSHLTFLTRSEAALARLKPIFFPNPLRRLKRSLREALLD